MRIWSENMELTIYTRERYDLPGSSPVYACGRQHIQKIFLPADITACPMLREGQVFYADYAKPEGLCDEAWKAICQYVFVLAHGAGIIA